MSTKEMSSEMKTAINAVSLLLVVISVIVSVYYYNQYSRTKLLMSNPNLAAKEESDAVTKKLGVLMELPKDEQPTVVTVLDTTKLQGQAFFKNAKNGDKVVVYSKIAEAILYRPTTNMIINVAPVQMDQAQNTIRIGLIANTKSQAAEDTLEADLKTKVTNVTVSKKTVTATIKKTIVVDVANKPDAAKQLAQMVGGEVGTLPAGVTLTADETKNLDLLVVMAAPAATSSNSSSSATLMK